MTEKTDLLGAIGNTPLVRLDRVVPAGAAEVWLKVEGGNPTGSYKDRMAVSVLTGALSRGDIEPGGRVVEYTGGSTGAALAFVSAVLGLRFTAVSSNAFAEAKLRAMRAYGAEVLIEESPDGTITPDLIQRMKARAHSVVEETGGFYADQFGSPDVISGYEPMGAEIVARLGRDIDCLCAGVGTGAALMGTLAGIEKAGGAAGIIALEPLQSPLLTTGAGGPHRVEGIGVGFAPPFLDRSRCRDIRAIDQDEAFAMCRRLARDEGILCGASTGLNVVAAIAIAGELGPGKRVVTLGVDSGMKYLAGDLFL